MPNSRAEQLIDPPDHVLDDLRRRVPDAQFLAQLGVERLQERLVEQRDGVVGLESLEELLLDDAVQAGGGPFQRLAEAQVGQAPRPGDFLVQVADQRQGQVARWPLSNRNGRRCGGSAARASSRRRGRRTTSAPATSGRRPRPRRPGSAGRGPVPWRFAAVRRPRCRARPGGVWPRGRVGPGRRPGRPVGRSATCGSSRRRGNRGALRRAAWPGRAASLARRHSSSAASR